MPSRPDIRELAANVKEAFGDMDRETLLAHRDRWVTEDRPATSVLSRLTLDEQNLYTDLVEDGLGDRVRLEQERVDWCWAQQRLRDVTRVQM